MLGNKNEYLAVLPGAKHVEQAKIRLKTSSDKKAQAYSEAANL